MNKTTLQLKQWKGQENPFGDPESRSEQELWELMLEWFQSHPQARYLKHFHDYRFIPEVPERLQGEGTGRSRAGSYFEVLDIYWDLKP